MSRIEPVRTVPFATLLLPLLLAAPVTAQEESRERERCVCLAEAGDLAATARSFMAPRARLGVELGEAARVDGRSGVALGAVPAESPAYRSGLRSGDVILALDGEALGDEPAAAMVAHMRTIEPGDTVAVSYAREGRESTALVITEPAAAVASAMPFYRRNTGEGPAGSILRPGVGDIRLDLRRGPEAVESLRLFRIGDREMGLVEVGPELGRYFGTDRGVLVTRAPDDAGLGLEAGDVILEIGGREVRSPGHARSIIASYLPDEPIQLTVMRDRRQRDVTGSRSGP